jgi:hypothetical protein
MTKAASPTATGPSGAHFEAKVGAYYLLALLLDAEPRGLPGARIQRIQLQGAGDGFPPLFCKFPRAHLGFACNEFGFA